MTNMEVWKWMSRGKSGEDDGLTAALIKDTGNVIRNQSSQIHTKRLQSESPEPGETLPSHQFTKKGDKRDPKNYYPDSLLTETNTIWAKIMQKKKKKKCNTRFKSAKI